MTSFQSSELTELTVVENSQLFAQRAHSARYAPQFLKHILTPPQPAPPLSPSLPSTVANPKVGDKPPFMRRALREGNHIKEQ